MDIIKHKFYVGTSRGLLISTGEKPNTIEIFNSGENTEVTSISEGRNSDEIIVGFESGNAHIFDTTKASFVKEISNLEGGEALIGLCCIDKSIILAKKDGVINIWNNKKSDYFSLNLDESGSLDVMVCNKNRGNIIGTGGEVNDYKLWDVESKQIIFKAKSLGHDHLQLPIPTSVRGISFFTHEPHLGACCTKEGHVLLYDDRAQRRPIVKFVQQKASYTCISNVFGTDIQVLVGTTKGYMQWLDLRNPSKVLKTYTTYTGCITDIVCDPLEPYVASVSLDRHLRVHKMDSKELVSKLYMKQHLTKLLVKPKIKNEEGPEQVESEEVDPEYEELFRSMEAVEETSDRKIIKAKRTMSDVKTIKKNKKKKS